jgi:hypothetical protein
VLPWFGYADRPPARPERQSTNGDRTCSVTFARTIPAAAVERQAHRCPPSVHGGSNLLGSGRTPGLLPAQTEQSTTSPPTPSSSGNDAIAAADHDAAKPPRVIGRREQQRARADVRTDRVRVLQPRTRRRTGSRTRPSPAAQAANRAAPNARTRAGRWRRGGCARRVGPTCGRRRTGSRATG